jgi:hypothetical protein
MRIWPVGEARTPNFPSIFGVARPGSPRSTTNPPIVARPHDQDVGYGRVRDPRLGAAQAVAAVDPAGAGAHARGIRAVVGFGEAEAAEDLAACHSRQQPALQVVVAVPVNRSHGEAGMRADGGAEGGIDPFELACRQSVRDMAEPRAAMALQRAAEQPEVAELAHQGGVESLVSVPFDDKWRKSLIGEAAHAVPDLPFLDVDLFVEEERVRPVERVGAGGHHSSGVSRETPSCARRRSQGDGR